MHLEEKIMMALVFAPTLFICVFFCCCFFFGGGKGDT